MSVFFFVLSYIYFSTVFLLMRLYYGSETGFFKILIDTYTYVMFGALSVDTSFSTPYTPIIIILGKLTVRIYQIINKPLKYLS